MSALRPQHDRFKSAPWFPKEDTFVLIGGAGGIGSWTALLLARAGFKPIVFDNDILEAGNLAGQMYPNSLIGKPKVVALQTVIRDFSNDDIMIFNEKITRKSMSHEYCISAFDNMKARKDMFDNWYLNHSIDNPNAIFIDGRLAAEQLQIFCVTQDNAEDYKQFLFSDEDVEDAPCTMKQTSHAAAMIASFITGFFTNHITNVIEKETVRTVPFQWEYFIPMDLITQ